MWVTFLRPACGWAYSEGMVADLPEEKALHLISCGYAVPCSEEERPTIASDLPEDFPARSLLLREGLYTKEKVLSAIPVLHELRGIGVKTVEEIRKRLTIEL